MLLGSVKLYCAPLRAHRKKAKRLPLGETFNFFDLHRVKSYIIVLACAGQKQAGLEWTKRLFRLIFFQL